MTDFHPESNVPILFLDTNIILDVLWARETGDDSAELVENIRNRGWQAVTSTFAIMEVTSQEQEERYVEDQRREGVPFRNIYRQLGSRVTDSGRLRNIHLRTERLLKLRLPFWNIYGSRRMAGRRLFDCVAKLI